MAVINPVTIHQKNSLRSETSYKPRQTWQVRPRPISHERIHSEWKTACYHVLFCSQNMDIQPTVSQTPTEMKGMVSLSCPHRGKCSRNDENSHSLLLRSNQSQSFR